MPRLPAIVTSAIVLAALGLAVSGCAAPVDGTPVDPAPTGTAEPPRDLDAFEQQVRALLTVPPMPSFSIPTSLLSTDANQRIADELELDPGLYQGIAVLDARCTEAGDAGAADAGASAVSGAQNYDDGTVDITVAGDGTGVYDAPGVHIAVLADGSGVYDDGETRLSVSSDGSGTYESGDRRYTVRADGSGTYTDDESRIWVDASGAGGYDDGSVRVSLSADGEAFGDGTDDEIAVVAETLADGMPLFPPVPRIEVLEPTGTVCGTVIRLDSNVLFGFDSATVQQEGQEHLQRVAALLVALGSPRAQVNGHSDQVGEAEYNRELSERRATVVRDLLVQAGVASDSLAARGLGETEPLRAETLPDGSDDPAARQLNRRVEIVLLD
ncbi:OmpA family protein [Microbacterium sp. HJ5]